MSTFTFITSEQAVAAASAAPARVSAAGRIAPALACAAALCGLGAMPAHAQLARTFVSAALGNDANNCDRLTPCRTFQHAHDTTLANGEITVLDPGGYGAVTINRTISITNDGVGEAGVLVSGGATGILINANADDAVSLRGLTIKGIGFGGGNGITFNAGKSLTVENCAIRNLDGTGLGNGISFHPRASSSLAVTKTVVADNSAIGIDIAPTGSGTVGAVLNRVEIYNNGSHGLSMNGRGGTGTVTATASNTVSAGNGGTGFFVLTNDGLAATSLMLVRSVSANNAGAGLASQGGLNAALRFAQSTITGNFRSFIRANAFLSSFGDNNVDDNGPPVGGADQIATK
jgi:hypothetical protein